MPLEGLLSVTRQLPVYQALLERLRAGGSTPDQHLLRAARPFVSAALANDLDRPVLVVAARVERAYNVVEQLPVWLPNKQILRFTEPSSLFYERSPWASGTIRSRLDVLAALCPPIESESDDTTPKPLTAAPPIIVASALSLMQHTLPVRDFRAASRWLKVNQPASPDKLLRQWLSIGYVPTSVVLEPGTFNRRSGVIDIFPINANQPVRIEFFGDTIESLRLFDPATQRSSESVVQVSISPVRESLPKFSEAVASQLQGWFAEQPSVEEDVTSAAPDEQLLASASAFPVLEFYLPYFYSSTASLLDYLPENTLVIVEDWDALSDSIAELEAQAIETRREKVEANQLPPDYPLPYFTWDDIQETLLERTPLHLGVTHIEGSEAVLERADDEPLRLGAAFAPGPHHGGQLRPLMESVRALTNSQDHVVIVSNQSLRLVDLWQEQYLAGKVGPQQDLTETPGELTFIEGALAEGWTLKTETGRSVHLFTDAEIFGWQRPEPRRHRTTRTASPETSFADLAPGDYVVHIEYGIGRFTGMRKRLIEGSEREYLMIQFAGSDMLYVPIHQADRLSRYVGAHDDEPTLNRLGGGEWNKTKEAAREAAEHVARELLELYAARAHVQGHAFGSDSSWQHELEASFPYVETDDQLRALHEVKADMERSTPMDRLICGDVGYGKTEVALRAAFKAVMDAKQVAILVPTTVLAQQHYVTFTQRLAAFPVRVEMLSRFRTRQEQAEILARTARGEGDILIGTHRLLQADVSLRDLGLLIIDEEQRFGVTHKERLKQMRTEVDVLTLTATPIPRTLYMSLSGIRDISMIQTPPEERLPVLTHVGPYVEHLIRQAVLREIDRGGQIFFLHNRVSTIQSVERRLQALVPEASIAIGHGQMPEDELELVMTEFAAGQYDILLCTTIIESGLDIPNANTIIIDRADMMGLAQLYQLRGRVGRAANRAYAYLFHPRTIRLTEDARARLDTIAEQTELGSGMDIAFRDLEIRGSGDLLGTRQSGYIASVGFYLYTQLLAQAVKKLKAEQSDHPDRDQAAQLPRLSVGPTTTIDLPLPTFIPVDFIPEVPLRLQIYRRLADLRTEAQVEEMRAELTDRFGNLPSEIHGLLFQILVKLRAERANVTAIAADDSQISIRLPYLAGVDRPALQNYLGHDVRVSRTSVWLPLGTNPEDWQQRLLAILDKLRTSANEAVQQ